MHVSFPGAPGQFVVEQVLSDKPDPKPHDFVGAPRIWKFFNCAEKESLINNFEVWQDRSGISLLDIFFVPEKFNEVKQAFSQHSVKTQEYPSFCKVQVTDPRIIKACLESLASVPNKLEDYKTEKEIKAILAKL